MNPLKFHRSSYNAKWSPGRLFGMGIHFTRGRIVVGSLSDKKALNKNSLSNFQTPKESKDFSVLFAEKNVFKLVWV